MGVLAALHLLLLLIFPLSSSHSLLQSKQELSVHQGAAAPPPPSPPPHIRDLLLKDDTGRLNAKRTYAHVDKDNAKIGLFIAVSAGTVTLMAVVYCIYNQFYTKHQYLHTQLRTDADGTTDSMDSPVFFHASASSSSPKLQKSGYGALLDSPSIISLPPSLSPPPNSMPFPPPFLSSRSLRTISAQDLEKSCI